MKQVTFDDFLKLDIRVGRVVELEDFPEAKKPSYKLKIDFGEEVGIKQSSAQLCSNYTKKELKGKLILAVVNFPPKRIWSFMSEVLVLGVPDKGKECILIIPEKEVGVGGRLY